MKTIALASILLLFAACASPTALIQETFNCDSGEDLEIRAGLADPRSSEQIGQHMFLVEVANNSSEDLTVKSVLIDPDESARRLRRDVSLERAYREFNETIPEGTEHVFELPATAFGTLLQPGFQDDRQPGPLQFVVTVSLTNGDVYRCPFAVGR